MILSFGKTKMLIHDMKIRMKAYFKPHYGLIFFKIGTQIEKRIPAMQLMLQLVNVPVLGTGNMLTANI
jgi:hypothetical protein